MDHRVYALHKARQLQLDGDRAVHGRHAERAEVPPAQLGTLGRRPNRQLVVLHRKPHPVAGRVALLGHAFDCSPCQVISMIKTGMSKTALVEALASQEIRTGTVNLGTGVDGYDECIDPCRD